jgi:hypothetical protein
MLNDLIKNLIINATKTCGRSNSDDILSFVEEQMTPAEYKKAKAFLEWSFKTGKTFGWNNFDDRVIEFETSKQRSN